MTTAYVVLLAVAGLVAGVLLRARLATLDHRYDDEEGTRTLGLAWVPVVCAVVVPLVAVGGWRLGGWTLGLLQAVVALVLVALAAVDLDVHRLPDRMTLPLLGITVVGLAVVVVVTGDTVGGVRALVAGVGLGAVYLVLALLGGGSGMGLGDVKLAPSLGLLLGFHSWSHVVVATALAFVTGTLWGLWLLVSRRGGMRSAFAFGPHMIGAALLVLAMSGVGPVLDQL